MEEIRYFDNAATTKVKDEVIKTMIPYFGIEFGNPSSMYKIGRSAKRAIEDARKKVAELINCNASEIIFTAGGSESDNTALKGIAHLAKNKGKHIITSKIEHHAVLNSCKELEKEGYAVTQQEGYKIMAYRSPIGYVNAIALPENTYQKEMNMWRLKLVVIILAAFGIFSSSVFYLYRLICKPLNQFQKQMIQVGNGSLQEAEQEYEIKEFDDLMHEVEQMKEQIRNLIDDVVEKEKSIQRTEYEKLLYQINPHFLLNTLNSVQWMARMSKQDNITEFVQRLKRLLSYNLGKEGMQTTLRTEIDIVKDYIALEQMRYDFVIEMNVEEGRYLEQPTVRMLLQPLVENAIRYGLGDDEKITIQVFEDNIRGLAIITILDSGNGLTQEEINQINEPFDYDVKKMQHGNRGIGLRYVKAMLESFYEGETNLFVNCKKGYGTKITILIPIQEELRNKIKITGSGTEKEGMEK